LRALSMQTKRAEYITKSDAVSLIIGRVDKQNEPNKGDWRRTITKRLNRAIKRGEIAKISEKLVFQDFLRYCQKKYGVEPFLDYGIDAYATGSIAPITMEAPTGFAFSTPSTLEGCQSLISELYSEIHRKNQEIERLKEEIENLRPDAERYWGICVQNRINGGMPRGK
jgi:hypothetical protein